MKKGGIFRKSLFILCCAGLLSLSAVSVMAAAKRPRPTEQMGGPMQRPEDIRKQEQQQQAQQASSLVDRALDDFFSQVNEWKDPGQLYIKSAAVLLEENRRHMTAMEDPQKARFMLLQSWVEYGSGQVELALTSGTRACRTDAASRDSWISQQYFSVLMGKRPLQPRPPRMQTMRRPGEMMQAGQEMMPETAAGQSLFGSAGKLEFDPESLRGDLIGRELNPFTGTFIDGKSIDYQHDQQVLCLLFWEIPEEKLKEKPQSEPTERLLYTQPGPGQAAQTPGMDESATYIDTTVKAGVDLQLEALRALREQAADKKEIRFFTVVTNKPEQKEAVLKYLADNPHPQPVLYPYGTAPDLILDAKTPFVLVVDKAGLFRFAGSAQGFMLPMILARLTGLSFTKTAAQGAGLDPSMGIFSTDSEFRPRMPGDPNHPAPMPGEPNSPSGTPIPLQRPRPPTSKQVMQEMKDQAVDPVERIPTQDLTPEEACGAQQLAAARDFFMQAANRKFISYRKGIDLCRQVIKGCPNSENAKAARQLLRDSIPEDQREKYGLTNEELGL
jgi:hypothetical protein